MTCNHCSSQEQGVGYPCYGMAPHTHVSVHQKNGRRSAIGSTQLAPREDWPPNFVEDSESVGYGIWYCPHCFSGHPSKDEKKAIGQPEELSPAGDSALAFDQDDFAPNPVMRLGVIALLLVITAFTFTCQ